MSKLLPMKPREVIKILEDNEFEFVKQKGSHRKFAKIINGRKLIVIVPIHDREITKGVLLDIIKSSEKNREEFTG